MDRDGLAKLLGSGADSFNAWRASKPDEAIDLSNFVFSYKWGDCPALDGIDLHGATLNGIEVHGPDKDYLDETAPTFKRASFRNATIQNSYFYRTSFDHADLCGADLRKAEFKAASLNGANLENALLDSAKFQWVGLRGANLNGASFVGAALKDCNLTGANLNGVSFLGATLKDCDIHGIAAWDIKTDSETEMEGLTVTNHKEARIAVDTLELAQFVYMLTHNPSIRKVLDAVTAKVVLILGRFSEGERKQILDQLRLLLRQRGYIPILFDFERSASRDLTETISLLAGMSRFVIADLTDAKSLPQELLAIVPNLPSVPVQPLVLKGHKPYAMFEHFRRFPWVIAPFEYLDCTHLQTAMDDSIITPAENLLISLRVGRVD